MRVEELDPYRFRVFVSHSSEPIYGDHDWVKLTTEFEVEGADPVRALPCLVVEGSGTAWFDDIELTEIAR